MNEMNIARRSGLGDVLMCTPVLRKLKFDNPNIFVRFYTNYTEIVSGLEYIDEVRPFSMLPNKYIYLGYENKIPPQAKSAPSEHLARVIGSNLGINVEDTTPDCVLDIDLVEKYRREWNNKPTIVVARRSSRWTENKDWPMERWDALVSLLTLDFIVIEIGDRKYQHELSPISNYVDCREKTSIKEMVAIVAAANCFVGPDTGPTHVAAAVGTPAVVILGGYNRAVNVGYKNQIIIDRTPECSPCFLTSVTSECKNQKKCLSDIMLEDVMIEIYKIFKHDI